MREVDSVIKALELTYLVCGAVGRDILLKHVYGIETGAATLDVDFGVAVENWKQFDRVKAELTRTTRFNAHARMVQRLYYMSPPGGTGYPVDIIPFGRLANPKDSIAWPPDGHEVMNVIGYHEALTAAVQVEIEKGFVVPVISLPGLALLKLFAWMDRGMENSEFFPSAVWPCNRKVLGYPPSPHNLNEPKSLYHFPSGTSGLDPTHNRS